MGKPTVLVPLKNIFLLWTESSDRSRSNHPFVTWAETGGAVHAAAKVAPEGSP
ncbi:MAG: hypothetical protein WCG85_18220 [Polyangia bacterium]|jgi:hypothetical protein